MPLRAFLAALVAVITGTCALAGTSAAQGANADPARMAAAKEMMDAVGTTRQLDAMVSAIASGFQHGTSEAAGPAAGERAREAMEIVSKKFLAHRQDMLNDLAAVYAERFTAEELQALTNFYRSGPGAKFIAQMPELAAAGQTVGTRYAQKVIDEIRAEGSVAPRPKPAPAP